MTHFSTLVDLLRHRAAEQPDRQGYIFLPDGETESGILTYQLLDQQAKAIAAQLQALGATGSRALVVYPYTAGLEFIAAFFGCLYAGVVAVTDNPPRSQQSIFKFQERVISSQSTVVLTTASLVTKLKQAGENAPELAQLNSLPWIATDTVPLSDATHWQEPDIAGDSLAFLQYTSGSTGTPKGVMVTHENALHNSKVIKAGFEHTPETRALIWLPLFHDMGLIGGIVQPLYSGYLTALMSPVALIQKPYRWLEAISRYRVNTSGGPNFAFDLLGRQTTPEQVQALDLSCWDMAFSGAEPVRAETLDRFAQTFAPCGFRKEAFYPCYGMAETTLFIAGGDKKALPIVKYVDAAALEKNQVIAAVPGQPGTRAVVGCGKTRLGDQIIIVDPETKTLCSSDQIGEIWIAGTGVGLGYWNEPEETEQTFRAYFTPKADGPCEPSGPPVKNGPFLRTGDLGFVEDGELFITGRLKDLMILWGRNHYPQHIEQTVERCHPDLRPHCGAAFSIEVEGEEKLVIVQEVQRTQLKHFEIESVVGAIRQAVAEQHIADVYAIALLKTGGIPKTTSGKIQRRGCRTKFLEGSLDIVGHWQQSQPDESSISELASRSES